MWDRPVEASERGLMNTEMHLDLTTTLLILPHISSRNHIHCPIHNTMQILKRHSKGTHLNTIQRFYIYAEYVNNKQLNDKHTISPNSIFEDAEISTLICRCAYYIYCILLFQIDFV